MSKERPLTLLGAQAYTGRRTRSEEKGQGLDLSPSVGTLAEFCGSEACPSQLLRVMHRRVRERSHCTIFALVAMTAALDGARQLRHVFVSSCAARFSGCFTPLQNTTTATNTTATIMASSTAPVTSPVALTCHERLQ